MNESEFSNQREASTARPIPHTKALTLLEQIRGCMVKGTSIGEDYLVEVDLSSSEDVDAAAAQCLSVYSSFWRIETQADVVVSCADPTSRLAELVPTLVGCTLTAVQVEQPSLAANFWFGDLVLRTFPVSTKEYRHWTLGLPQASVLVAGPGSAWFLEAGADAPAPNPGLP